MQNTLQGQNLGKYKILEPLGQGGMAQVYRAYHPGLDRYLAIKVLRQDLPEEEGFLERFRHEARAVSRLRHPNIVQVLDFDTQGETAYMVMELLEGDTLRARLAKYRAAGQTMPLPEALHILQDALRGLEYAHAEGIIHRDIKPANLMLTGRGQTVLTDFGIAHILGITQYTLSGALLGTLSYMPPEQGLTGQSDPRSDLYSLGIVLYEMLVGKPPFAAETPFALMLQHLQSPPPLPSALGVSLPAGLEQILLSLLAKDPAQRPPNAEEVQKALQKLDVSPSRPAYSGEYRVPLRDLPLLQENTDRIPPAVPSAASRLEVLSRLARPIAPVSAAFAGLTLFTAFNVLATTLGKITNHNFLAKGWAYEVFLLTFLLALIGWGAQTAWMLTPGILLLGNGILFAYTALTGRWGDWAFLWMLEPLLVGLAIYLPPKFKTRPQAWGRVSGMVLATLSLVLAGFTCAASYWLGN